MQYYELKERTIMNYFYLFLEFQLHPCPIFHLFTFTFSPFFEKVYTN